MALTCTNVMCGNVERRANGLANASQTPNQSSETPTEKDDNPVEAGLTRRRRYGSPGSSLCVKLHVSSLMPNLTNKAQRVNYS